MQSAIEFRDTISVDGFCQLRESVGFQRLTPEQAKRVISSTTLIVTAVCDEKYVGLVRILTDTLTDAYITDVIISPQFQGQGLGRQLMEYSLSKLKTISVSNVRLACSLYANAGKEPFYEKFGFEKLPNNKYGYGMIIEL